MKAAEREKSYMTAFKLPLFTLLFLTLVFLASALPGLSYHGNSATNDSPSNDESHNRMVSDRIVKALNAALHQPGVAEVLGNTGFIEAARNDVLKERESRSTDPILRDAEYFYIGMRAGYAGGLSEIIHVIGTPLYNMHKVIAETLGHPEWTRANPSKPNSPPGGTSWAYRGLYSGFSGKLFGGSSELALKPIHGTENESSIYILPVDKEQSLYIEAPTSIIGFELSAHPKSLLTNLIVDPTVPEAYRSYELTLAVNGSVKQVKPGVEVPLPANVLGSWQSFKLHFPEDYKPHLSKGKVIVRLTFSQRTVANISVLPILDLPSTDPPTPVSGLRIS